MAWGLLGSMIGASLPMPFAQNFTIEQDVKTVRKAKYKVEAN